MFKIRNYCTQDADEIWQFALPTPGFDLGQNEILRRIHHSKFWDHNHLFQLKINSSLKRKSCTSLASNTCSSIKEKGHIYLAQQRQITLQLHQKLWVASPEEYLF
jgi:hypothetical protein